MAERRAGDSLISMQMPVQSIAQPLPSAVQPTVGVPKKPTGHVAVQLAPGIVRLHPPVGNFALVGNLGNIDVRHPAQRVMGQGSSLLRRHEGPGALIV